MEPLINRVAESDIEVYNLDECWDGKAVVELDMEQIERGPILPTGGDREGDAPTGVATLSGITFTPGGNPVDRSAFGMEVQNHTGDTKKGLVKVKEILMRII